MGIRYNGKVSTQSNRITSIQKKDRFSHPRPAQAPWVRPNDWLTAPTFTPSEQKIALLIAVYPTDSNWIAFTISGAYTVDWGDGVTENVATATRAQHNYVYSSLASSVRTDGSKLVYAIITPQVANNLTSVNFNVAPVIAGSTFSNVSPIIEIIYSCPNAAIPTIGAGTAATSFCRNLVSFIGLYMGTGSQTAANLFRFCHSLENVVLENTPTYTSCATMFGSCSSLTHVATFNTSSSTSVGSMFSDCYSLVHAPMLNTGSCTTTANMFDKCFSLTNVPLYNLSSCTTVASMFNECRSLESVPLFNTALVTNFNNLFVSCQSLIDVPAFNTSSATGMASMFSGCISITKVPLFNTSLVTTMASMFANCQSLLNVPLFNTSLVNTMANMFDNCLSLKKVPLFNTASVTSMANMFVSCLSLTDVPLFNTSSVTLMSSMFSGCQSITEIPFFVTSNVTTMASMFLNCYGLGSIPLFDTSKVTSMANMFQNCVSLRVIPSFDTSLVITFATMCSSCYSLVSVNFTATGTGVSTTGKFTNMFTNCYSLKKGKLGAAEYTVSFTGCSMAEAELEEMMTALDTIGFPSQTLTITNNFGALTLFSLAGTTTAGSTTITMANTTGITAGMQVTGTGTAITTGRAVTFTDTGDLVELATHGLENDDQVSFSTVTTTTGIGTNVPYFIINKTANNFQLAAKTTAGTPHSDFSALALSYNPVAYYRLSDASGTTAVDETGNFNGTYINSPTLGSDGVFSGNNAVTLNGTTQGVSLPNLGINGGSARTISAWVYPTSNTGIRTIYNHNGPSGSVTTGTVFTIYSNYYNSGDVLVAYGNGAWSTAGSALPLNQWTLVTVTYPTGENAGAAGILKIYINGVQQPLTKTGGSATNILNTTSSPSQIGYNGNTNLNFFEGKIDEVLIYNKELVNYQVFDLFAAAWSNNPIQLSTNGSGTVRYRNIVASVTPGVSVTLTRPAATSATNTLIFRDLDTSIALLKGWAVTG